MTKLYYQFPNTWFGDCMPFGKGDQFYPVSPKRYQKTLPVWRTLWLGSGGDF